MSNISILGLKTNTADLGIGMIKKIRQPKVEVLYGKAVLSDIKGQKPYYATFHDLKSGELVGMQEGDYTLFQKDGKFIENTFPCAIDKPHYNYTAVSDVKTGRVERLTEDSFPNPILTLTEDKHGNIISSKKSQLDNLFEAPERLEADLDAINARNKYLGEKELKPGELYCSAAQAILNPLTSVRRL